MTRSQLALASRSDEKWVENAGRLLGLKLRYTTAEARWLGLVRILNIDVGLTLGTAAALATEALRSDAHSEIIIMQAPEGSAGVAIYLARYYSTYAAALSAALELGGARRRGRRRISSRKKHAALAEAAHYGLDIDLLKEGLKLSTEERLALADENAAFVNALHPLGRRE